MIDVRGKLKPKDIQNELDGNDELTIQYELQDKVVSQTFANFDILTTDFIGQYFDNIVGDITVGNLLISKADYAWWWKNDKRRAKLFKEDKPVKVEPSVLKVGCANITENGIEQLKVCEGSKKEILAFINEQLNERYVKSLGEAFVVFKFDYEDEDKHHPESWFTIEELAEKGIVKLS